MSDPSSPTPSAQDPLARPTPGRTAVLSMCLVVAGLLVTLISLLYFGWYGRPVPSAVVWVLGSPAYEGAKVRIYHGSQPGVERVLDDDSDFACQFFVPPQDGNYRITVQTPRGSMQSYSVPQQQLRAYQRVLVKLPTVTTTMPATTQARQP